MKKVVNRKGKNANSLPPGKPNSNQQQQFKLIKIRSELYFRLLDLKDRRRGRCTFNKIISDLLNYYLKSEMEKSANSDSL
jgi:hypothetical protein